jgi:hypothetical protein
VAQALTLDMRLMLPIVIDFWFRGVMRGVGRLQDYNNTEFVRSKPTDIWKVRGFRKTLYVVEVE